MSRKNENYVVESPRKRLPITDLNFTEFFIEKITTGQNENDTAIIVPDRKCELTFGQLHQQIQKFAKAFLNVGIDQHDLIYFFGDNSFDYLLCEMAAIYLGIVFSPIKPAAGPYEMIQQMLDSNGTILFLDPERVDTILLSAMNNNKYNSAIKKLKMIIVFDLDNDDDKGLISAISQHPMAPEKVLSLKNVLANSDGDVMQRIPYFEKTKDDLLMIIYTSGTTGEPKGVMYSHNMCRVTTEIVEPFFSGKRIVFWPPLGHISGAFMTLYYLCHGKCIILQKEPIIHELLSSVEKYKAEILLIALENATDMSNEDFRKQYDLDSLRVILFGGCKIPTDKLITIRDRYNVLMQELYGSTEFMMSNTNIGDANEPLGSVGPPSAYCEMKIIDLKSQQNLPAFGLGEICMKGPQMFVGYFNKQKATAEAIDENGWYHTGDIGYYDRRGFLFIEDRIKEIIKFRHWTVYPAQIESFIYAENPAIKGVCVVGVTHAIDGQWPRAYVELRPGFKISKQELIKSVQENLGFHQRLRGGVEFVDKFQRTSIGKIDRKACRSLIADEVLTEIVE